MEESFDLKECPFCGSNDIDLRATYSHGGWMVYCKCAMCRGQGGIFNSKTDPAEDDWEEGNVACRSAIRAWNKRVTQPIC